MVAKDGAVRCHVDSPRLSLLSLLVLGVAALAAALAVVPRSDGGGVVGSASAAPAAALQVTLPGIGTGAPRTLDELSLLESRVSRVELTARRYATHLMGDVLHAPQVAIAPLDGADQVQVALTMAAKPQLYRAAPAVDQGPISQSVLVARLGLEAGEALPPYFTYTIQRGDTVEKLATRFGLQPESILFNNFELGDPDRLPVGGQLTIPTADGVVYTVVLGDTLFEIAENYAADIDDIVAFEGNNLASANDLREGETILLVGGSASLVGPIGGAFGGVLAGPPDFAWPIGGPGVTVSDFYGTPRANRYGFHTGVDWSAPTGTFVGATAPGIVIQAGWDGSYGYSVLVDHGGGYVSRYAHLSAIDVFLGEYVDTGSLIGFSGSTGLSSGPHLHFEIIAGGSPQDPLVWLNS